jgi:hypothetical protein
MPLTTDGFGALPYDRATQCLEVRFTWKNVHQYRPVPLKVVREIWKARPMNMALDTLVMKNRRIRFEEVAPKEAARVVATWLGDNIFVTLPLSPAIRANVFPRPLVETCLKRPILFGYFPPEVIN